MHRKVQTATQLKISGHLSKNLRKNRRIFYNENQLWNAIHVEWNRLDSVEVMQNLTFSMSDRYREVIEANSGATHY